MKTAHICFLWHMHQPYYTDPVSGSSSMPWVRLHATKAYFDMASLLERFPTVRATVNLTPSLLVQLKELTSGSVRDLFLEHAQRPAAELSPPEQAFTVRHFFAANWGTMVRPYSRYHELLVKRGTDVTGQDLDRLARRFTPQDLLDLQVWHNLAWFGYGTVARHPRLAALRVKGRGFSEDDKREVLALQQDAVSQIIPLYRKLAESGQIELTTSPFYHPILPLLIDTDIAKRSRPETALPQRFQAPADAEAQIQKAVALHGELFGMPPAGLWPSEGSVCPEMAPILRRAGLRWMATDEGVLHLLESVRVSTETISRFLDIVPPATRLEHLHSGSWINQDFKIWLGHQEDNRAWDLLRHTRARLVEMSHDLSPDQTREAWEELYAAEGSDWFWWYGDEFETDYKSEFDRLFR